MQKTNSVERKSTILLYILIAYSITWLCWIPTLLASANAGTILPNINTYETLFKTGFTDSRHLLISVIFQLGVYGPLVGALAATALENGKHSLQELWRRISKWHIPLRWYGFAVVLTFLMAFIPVAVFAIAGGLSPSPITLPLLLFVLAVQLLTSGLGEEPGWRGYLLPRLQARFSAENTIWILGLIWAVWHYPLVILQTMTAMHDVSLLPAIITILTSLAGMTMSQIGISYLYVWLYNRTHSIFLMIVFHAFSNLFSLWLPTFLKNPQSATLLVALMPWLLVVILQKKLGKEQFPG